jgi:nucleoside-diphosphate-sugar epimerase
MREGGGTALVTGASGFVGSHLVERLVAGGTKVRALLREGSSELWLPKSELVDVRRVSLRDEFALQQAVDGVRTVYHLAGLTSAPSHDDYYRVNRDATRNIVEAVKRTSPDATFVLCSSQAAAGPSRGGRPLTEEDAPQPISPYGKSKLEAEHIVLDSSLHASVVRPPTVYGPRDRDILEMFRWASRGLAPTVGPYDQKLSMIHVDDLVVALMAAAGADSGSVYFVTDGRVHRRSDLVRTIARAVERSTLDIRIPVGLALTWAHVARFAAGLAGVKPLLTPERIRDFSEPEWTCDDSRARAELGYRSSVAIDEGMRRTANWYREQKWI